MTDIQAKPSLREAVQNLPHLLRQAAEILEFKANVNGGRSLLTPKLNWYAERIEDALEETEPEKREGLDEKINALLELTDEFVFPAYYSHTDKKMWKISNVYTKWSGETLVLCGVDEGIEKALDLAIKVIKEKKDSYYGDSSKGGDLEVSDRSPDEDSKL